MRDWSRAAHRLRKSAANLRNGALANIDTEKMRSDINRVAAEAALRSRASLCGGAKKDRMEEIKKRVEFGELWPGDLEDASAIADAFYLSDSMLAASDSEPPPLIRARV